MNQRFAWKLNAQLVVVLLCALALKLYYSTASANQLRWILAPTTLLVELVSRTPFEFESHAGYLSSDRTFLIAASCAGVNFLLTSFLMLSLRKLWRDRSYGISWGFLLRAAVFAYLATLLANTVRISIALWLRRMPLDSSWLSANQLHRFEGIFIYFGFLLLLFLISEKLNNRTGGRPASPGGQTGWRASERTPSLSSENPSGLRYRSALAGKWLFPLLIYYVTTLGIPLANIAYRREITAIDFREHSVFVLLIPLLLILLIATFHFCSSIKRRLEVRLAARMLDSHNGDHYKNSVR